MSINQVLKKYPEFSIIKDSKGRNSKIFCNFCEKCVFYDSKHGAGRVKDHISGKKTSGEI